MPDISGDLTEEIDNQINKMVEQNIFMKALGDKSSTEKQRAPLAALTDGVYESDLVDEIYGYLRLSAIAQVLDAGGTTTGIAGFLRSFPEGTINVKAGEVHTDTERAERIISLRTSAVARALEGALDPLLQESFLPSELLHEKPELYKMIQVILRDKVSEVNKKMDEYIEDFSKAFLERMQEVEDDIAYSKTDAARLGWVTRASGPPRSTVTEDLNEEQLVTTVIDLEKLKSEAMNEIFLAQLGGAIELILGAMFDSKPLPVAITGVPKDVSAFAGALGGEKRYIEAAKRYGLNHPATYKNKAKLSSAVKKFERQTGIKWPFK